MDVATIKKIIQLMLTKDKCLLVANGKNNISRVGKRKTPLFVVGILLM